VATARNLWVPAVNAHGGLGRWTFLEVADPWNTQQLVRAAIRNGFREPASSAVAGA
jgi:type III restriction enzyme